MKYKIIEMDYKPDSTIFREEDEQTHILKDIIFHRLPQADRVIIILYAEFGSTRKLAEEFGVSHITIQRQVARIRRRIAAELRKIENHRRLNRQIVNIQKHIKP